MRDPEADRRLYHNARREGWIVTIAWVVTLLWTVGVCYVMGYQHKPESLVVQLGLAEAGPPHPGIILGFPDWVFWGIILPWLLASLFTVWFGLAGIVPDELGRDASDNTGEGSGHGH